MGIVRVEISASRAKALSHSEQSGNDDALCKGPVI